MLCGVISLVRLQGKFEFDHSSEWNSSRTESPRAPWGCGVCWHCTNPTVNYPNVVKVNSTLARYQVCLLAFDSLAESDEPPRGAADLRDGRAAVDTSVYCAAGHDHHGPQDHVPRHQDPLGPCPGGPALDVQGRDDHELRAGGRAAALLRVRVPRAGSHLRAARHAHRPPQGHHPFSPWVTPPPSPPAFHVRDACCDAACDAQVVVSAAEVRGQRRGRGPLLANLVNTSGFLHKRTHCRRWNAHRNVTFSKFLMHFHHLRDSNVRSCVSCFVCACRVSSTHIAALLASLPLAARPSLREPFGERFLEGEPGL